VSNDISTSINLDCPSAQPGMQNPVIIGVVIGSATAPRLHYLKKPEPVTPAVLAIAAPVRPTEVFRIAAKCAGSDCRHFDDRVCKLVRRVIDALPSEPAGLQACSIRRRCMWWRQEGRQACERCPGIVTDSETRDPRLPEIAG
jgi:hypothetical protein